MLSREASIIYSETTSNEFGGDNASIGGNGGGIVIILTDTLDAQTNTISANGQASFSHPMLFPNCQKVADVSAMLKVSVKSLKKSTHLMKHKFVI